MTTDQPLNTSQLVTRIAEVVRDANRLKPHLGRHILTTDMDVGRLTSVVTRKVDLIRPLDSDARHVNENSAEGLQLEALARAI